MIVVTCSAKHAPGATTLALALTCVLAIGRDEAPPLLVEADTGGGDLAARLGTSTDPGLATLAAASRHADVDEVVWPHAKALPAGGAVVVAPTEPAACLSSLRTIGTRLATILRTATTDSVIDVGRLNDSSMLPQLRADDRILVACRPDLAGLEHARRLVALLRSERLASVGIVTIGDRPYGPADAALAMQVEWALSVPLDPRGAASLLTGPRHRAQRTPLVRAACSIVEALRPAFGLSA